MTKRYDLFQVHNCGEERRGEMRRAPEGEFVAHEDYARLVEVLHECEEFFDSRADAEYSTDSATPKANEEMRLLTVVRDALRGKEYAAKRQGTEGGNDPADCNWPFCGCDPVADKVIAAIEEVGFRIVPAEPTQAMVSAAMHDLDTPFCDDLERVYRCMVAASETNARSIAPAAEMRSALNFVREAILDLLPSDASGDELKARIVQRIDAALSNITGKYIPLAAAVGKAQAVGFLSVEDLNDLASKQID